MENLNELLRMVVPRDWLFSVMPQGASIHADKIDFLYWFLIISCAILFLLVIVPLFLIVVRYRRKTPKQRALSQTDHNFWLESLWTFLPFIYLGVLFVWGFLQYLDMYVAPHDSKELRVIGQKWAWSIHYPKEGISVSGPGAEIVVPVDTPIKLIMGSQDVIHSFYIPNFRAKQDVVPGRYSTLWFRADKVGTYPVLCAEYCGDLHSQMLAKVVVKPQADYDQWVEHKKVAEQNLPLPELGKKKYSELGCVACHTTDGTAKIGPSFKGIYGEMTEVIDSSNKLIKVKVDDNYIMNKILEPGKTTVKGFPPGTMPTFKGRVKKPELDGLIEFIKSLSKAP